MGSRRLQLRDKTTLTLSEHNSNMSLFGFGAGITAHVKKLFNPSEVRISNFVFTLHQQWTFVIIIIGLIFSMGNNYLNKDAMIRLVGNLKGSQVSKLFDALDNEGQIQDNHNGEEGKALINHEENTEMTSIVVTKTG